MKGGRGSALRVAGALMVVLIATYVSLDLLHPFSPRATKAFVDLGQVMAPLLAAGACWLARKRCLARERWTWLLLGSSALSWAIGQAVWTYYEVVAHRDTPFPSWADAGYLGAVPLAVAAMMALPSTPNGVTSRARVVADGFTVAAALFFISWAVVLGPTYTDSTEGTWKLLLSLAYPGGDVVILTLAVITITRAEVGRRLSLVLVCLSLACLAMADSSFVLSNLRSSVPAEKLSDAGWFAGYAVLALSALATALRPVHDTSDVHGDRYRRLRSLLPYLFVPLVLLLAGAREARGVHLSGVLFWSGCALVTLLMLRHALTVIENSKLTASLAASVSTLRHQAAHDALTGLPNRTLLIERIGQAFARVRRTNQHAGLLFVDIDRFKTINDSLGHAAGDEVLRGVADRLRQGIRSYDTVVRFGGDEFIVLTESIEDLNQLLQRARDLAELIRTPITLPTGDLIVTASIGVALADHSYTDPDTLIRDADLAMYRAKELGRARVEIFALPLRDLGAARLDLEQQLFRAVQHEEFEVRFQPIIALRSGRIVGAEALVRWNHPQRGLLSPADFLDVAEETGLIVPVGRAVLAEACRRFSELAPAADGQKLGLAVNLSARELREPTVVDHVRDVLISSGLEPGRLCLEVSEQVIDEDGKALRTLTQLRDLGLRLAIDDFGTAYSSLRQLRTFPVTILKIDKSFVAGLGRVDDDGAIVTAITTLAKSLGLTVVAEGIEREDQLDLLRPMHCTYGQGYLFGPPEPFEAFVARLDARPALAPRA
ncbi:MAG: diguanylate cyclase/phosphodiesterase with sensor(s) [Acidimicrobiales bacterium]|nr:diguanylate cyclase/phosphodiesterase with sensor(s) [Acidimicrobiales bacterium]